MAKKKKKKAAKKNSLESYIQLMNDEGLDELEISEGKFHVKLVREGASAPVRRASAPSAPKPKKEKPAVASGHQIKSPLAGVFYRAMSPKSPPFVKEGDKVSVGKTLCIIEAMKVMNEIKSDKSGQIVEILSENGKPVSADQPLFVIETA